MGTYPGDDSRNENARGDWLYLLGRIAWRVFQAVLVTAGVVLVFSLVNPWHGGKDTKEKAYITTMRADLRNLVTAQEGYFDDRDAYAPSLEALGPKYYQTSTGVTIVIARGMADGFAATATHSGTPYRCGIFVASTPPKPEPVLSWSENPAERHDLLSVDARTWLERWPDHSERFHVERNEVVLGSTGKLIRKLSDRSLELFARDRGQRLKSVLWRQSGGPWYSLGAIVAGSESVPSVAPIVAAPHRMAPPWAGAREGVPLCWKG